MSAVHEAGAFLRSIPRHPDELKRAWVRRAAGLLGITYAQARKIIYAEVKTIDADTYLRMRERLNELQKAQIKRQETLHDAAILLASLRDDAARTAGTGRDPVTGGERRKRQGARG